MNSPSLPSFGEAFPVWLRIGLLSFGGPAAQIALMHRELVQERRWVGEARYLHALNFCMLLPGPEATQLATYLGWLMHGVKGGVVAGALFVLPGALILLALSLIYAVLGEVLVFEALLRVARRALHGLLPWVVAAAAFVPLFFFDVPFPAVVLGAALIGWAAPGAFVPSAHKGEATDAPAALDALLIADPGRVAALTAGARRAGLLALVLWLWPVALLSAEGGLYGDIAWFFSKMAVVTFGGAYAVLAYVAQEAVEHHRWLSPSEMLGGRGLAETTPGPLILVLEFVGFLAGWRYGGLLGGVAAAALTVWVTFVPCFAWIFLGAPFVERLHGHAKLSGALAGVTAAVVGVIANLALRFGLRVCFPGPDGPRPALTGMRWDALALSIVAALALFHSRLGVVPTLGTTAVAGLVVSLAL
ncbi:chromate transporter [Sabulicella rubraurantiaca]|uniref:chromate transporter n=1 Tax=Sabulicella rubraurantiaca TaxID=2811429 RepID=UPI001A977132|nr:chromate transporter [Sabulicella rubraurantiaca]